MSHEIFRIVSCKILQDCKIFICLLIRSDKNLFKISDNTKIDGIFQSEDYFYDKLDLVKDWLRVKPEHEHFDTNGENICVLNFRGSDMVGNPGCWLPRSYWTNAIQKIRFVHLQKVKNVN